MFDKASMVRVREYLEDSEPYEFDAILVSNSCLVAMDNGAILNPENPWIAIIKTYPWFPVSFDESNICF
jgi:hypothetical protein